jgi:pimeloyl-ACP methyl ester carboxylesterase
MTLGGLPHDPRVRAALVLSGDTFGVAGQGNVPVLVAEGTADPINPSAVVRVWSAASAPKALLRVLGGGHLAPFVTAGAQPDAVRASTVDFLDAALSGARDGLARLAHDGDVPGLTSLWPDFG